MNRTVIIEFARISECQFKVFYWTGPRSGCHLHWNSSLILKFDVINIYRYILIKTLFNLNSNARVLKLKGEYFYFLRRMILWNPEKNIYLNFSLGLSINWSKLKMIKWMTCKMPIAEPLIQMISFWYQNHLNTSTHFY